MRTEALLEELDRVAGEAFEHYSQEGTGERAWLAAEERCWDLRLDLEQADQLEQDLRRCCFDPAREVRIFMRLAEASGARGDIARAELQGLEVNTHLDLLDRAREAGIALRGESA